MMSWKNLLSCCACAASLSAQPAGTTATPAATPAAAAPAPIAGRQLKHILVAETAETVQLLAVLPGSGFVVLSPELALFDLAELTKRLAPGEGRIIDQQILGAIKQVAEEFFRQSGYPAATVDYPPSQNIAEGHLRVLVTPGAKAPPAAPVTALRVRNIETKGGRYFSNALLQQKLQLQKGETVHLSDLGQALDWTNNNPYRRIRVHLEPVPGSAGEADATISVIDVLPLRVTASIDNSGNEAIGEHRYIASANYANLWGLDHQIGYQYITTNKGQFFHVHGLDYRIPLPHRRSLAFSASYLKAKPEFLGGVFVSKGESINADIRYSMPLRTGENSLEAFALLSFKQTNNNLLFFGATAQTTKTDIVQLTAGLTGVWRDRRGAWAAGVNVTASPGGLTPLNTTAAFDASRHGGFDSARIGATASYIYAAVSAQRLLNLAPGWDVMARGAAQISQANLLSSEQFNVGGANSVRGFRENRFAGDNGFSITGEFLVPPWKLNLPRISKLRGPLESRLLAFFDLGDTSLRRNLTNDHSRHALASTGLGLRASLSYHFSLTADYGWQVSQPSPAERAAGERRERGIGHIKATLAF